MKMQRSQQSVRCGMTSVRIGFGAAAIVAATALGAGGCSNKPTLIPPGNPALRKTISQFAADGAKRHPFKDDLPSGGQAVARAEVDYGLDVLHIVNLSDEDWQNVELWVNHDYVVFVPAIKPKVQETVNFEIMYDGNGKAFPTDNRVTRVDKLQMVRDGKLYEIPLRLAD